MGGRPNELSECLASTGENMKDFECKSVLETITYSLEFQIRKHGNYCGATTVEEAVNGLFERSEELNG